MHWVYAEVRVETEEQARQIRHACENNALGPTLFVAFIQGRRLGRVFVKSQLANWAMSETALGAAGYRVAAATTSPMEADEIGFEGLAAYFNALEDGLDLPAHLAMVAVAKEREEKGNESAAGLARRLDAALQVGAEKP